MPSLAYSPTKSPKKPDCNSDALITAVSCVEGTLVFQKSFMSVELGIFMTWQSSANDVGKEDMRMAM